MIIDIVAGHDTRYFLVVSGACDSDMLFVTHSGVGAGVSALIGGRIGVRI